MKQKPTPLVEEYLQAFNGMQESSTGDFFYTRLKARMEREHAPGGWKFPLKPVWIVGSLTVLLAINGFMLSQQGKTKEAASANTGSSLQNFAESYDQAISSSY